MENINFKHSIIFFNFCILISPLYLMFNFEPVIFCLFLILILGISHGALDNIKGKKLLKLFGYKQTVSFYIAYVLISSLIINLSFILSRWGDVYTFEESLLAFRQECKNAIVDPFPFVPVIWIVLFIFFWGWPTLERNL